MSKSNMAHASTDNENQKQDPDLPVGTVLSDGQFTITSSLSAGGFGITYLAKDVVLNRTIVIKECFPEELCMRSGREAVVRSASKAKLFQSIVSMFMREARSLAQLRHPNIVGVHRAFEENGTAYMALDLIDGQDLLDILEVNPKALPSPDRIEEILLELLSAIEKIHSSDLLHRDISPDNIILDKSGTPVLIDFGAARAEASRQTRAVSTMIVVKDGYSPQELYVTGSLQTPSSDLYALAATFYHLISGKIPTSSQIRMAELVAKNPDPCKPLAGRIDGYAPGFLEAIDKAMAIVPRNRLQSAEQWRDLIIGDRPTSARVKSTRRPNTVTASADVKTRLVSANLERSLTRIVQETNAEVAEIQVTEPVDVKPVRTRPSRPISTPIETKPDWISEFNAETVPDDPPAEVVKEPVYEPPVEIDEPPVEAPVEARVKPSITSRVKTRFIHDEYSETSLTDSGADWTTRVIEKNQRAREQREREEQAAAELRRSNQSNLTSTLLSKNDPRLSGTQYEDSRLIEPLMKYLIVGITLGLAAFVLLQFVS